jgi:2-polyprenyl-6-methoxyphenol hydroxylase-like FAD-dependent oxidoreductase
MSPPPLQTIAIIGSGLGGLNLAQALKLYKPSLQVTIYEKSQDADLKSQGFHIGINNWGQESLKETKIEGIEAIFARNTVHGFTVLDDHLREVLRIGGPVKPGQASSKHATAIVDRAELRNAMTKGVNIEYGKKFIKYEEKEDKVEIFFEDGSQVEADFLVGADGCWSKVRAQLVPSIQYEPTGIISFGSLLNDYTPENTPILDKYLKYSMIRTSSPSGYSILIGLCNPLRGDKPVLFFGLSFPESIINENLPEERKEALDYAKKIVHEHFHPEVAAIADGLAEENVIFRGFYKTRTTNYQAKNPLDDIPHKRLTLVGDAAHGEPQIFCMMQLNNQSTHNPFAIFSHDN